MMNTKLPTLLKEYGLDENEIAVFEYLVAYKELTAYKIAKSIGKSRSTVYDTLERLISKGFISKLNIDGTAYYKTNPISKIISDVKNKENILNEIIPEIENIESKYDTNLRIFEGTTGQQQFNYILFQTMKKEKGANLFIIGNGLSESLSANLFVESLIRQARREKIHKFITYRGIWDSTFRDNKIIQLYNKIGENRFIEGIPSKVTTIIYGDMVGFVYTSDKPYAIQIKNELIAREMNSYFNHLWDIAKK